MPESEPKKIAYLFGAGATHAELDHAGADLNECGLLIAAVTRRVILLAKRGAHFLEHHRMFLDRAADSSNIELFISLIENNAYDINRAAEIVDQLKQFVETDIRSVLTRERMDAFYLHRCLFELHRVNPNESLLGLISLNYDTVLDEAYQAFHGDPDYNFSLATSKAEKPPLLKLHGSFSWDEIEINGKKRRIPIIPLGVNKNYLRLPYNFIWGRALEILTACDILRVIGCSLSPNDSQLIDLLFKAHIERGAPLEIEIISFEETGQNIRRWYDFFPRITTAEKIEDTLLPETEGMTNIFLEWLKAKAKKVLKDDDRIADTTYLRKIIL